MKSVPGCRERWIIFGVFSAVVTSWALAPRTVHVGSSSSSSSKSGERIAMQHSGAALTSVGAAYGKLPLSFEPNLGQTDRQAQFVTRFRGGRLFLTDGQAVLSLKQGENPQTAVVQMRWVGANDRPELLGLDQLPGYSNYFTGNDPSAWHIKVPQYRRVMYAGVYPGVDMVFYGNQRELEYDFALSPGADPNKIRLAFDGVEKLRLDHQGDLLLQTAAGEIRQRRPYVYQETGGARQAIAASYVLSGREVSLRLGAYDVSKALIIDPVIVYSSYLGGSGDDVGNAIAIDSFGNAYITGETNSMDFPIVGALQGTFGGLSDAFVTKIDPTGSNVLYSTYLGGDGPDRGNSIAVDGSGNAYVTGRVGPPSTMEFPTVNAPFSSYRGGEYDAWVAKISPDGSQLLYSTYFGGSDNDAAFGIAVDGTGNLYIVGGTRSTDDFPVTSGVVQQSNQGETDAWIARIDPTQVGFPSIIWAGFWGGSSTERANGVALDAAGNVYMTGLTKSTESEWAAANGFQSTYQGGVSDGFLVGFNSSGTNIVYSTYLGGSAEDRGNGVAVDPNGFVYVVGQTSSATFPTRAGFQTAYGGGAYDAFVMKIDPTQQGDASLVYSTFLGGNGVDPGNGLSVTVGGQVYVVGTTTSSNFPVSLDAFQASPAGGSDVFIAKIDPNQADAASLIYASYLGGSGSDEGLAIAADSAGNAYVTGRTFSTDFPVVGPFQPGTAGSFDAFVAQIADVGATTGISYDDAVRFLQQATFGATWGEIVNVRILGFEGWIDNQLAQPSSYWQDRPLVPATPDAACAADPACIRDNYRMYPVQQEFFYKALTQPDQLRQRMVFALDQIWVISAQWTGNFEASWMGYYLQVLDQGAFGNWRDLMQAVTLSPGMGKYLDMAGNYFVASRPANENYAREILQLFCVGLDELNDDGTQILDPDGNRLPTYTQDVVVGFSKVFTGWNLAPPIGGNPNWKDPMVPINPSTNHDHTDKLLLDGVTLPARAESACAGGCVVQDLNDALDNIFANHNVPPFISKQLIQKLVTSNPSPQYVYDIAQVFKDDGTGVRGNLAAVVKAILVYPEARGAPDGNFGKLREPVLAITNILRNFGVDGSTCSSTGNPCTDFVLGEAHQPNYRMDEDVFRSPTVFNFFPPDNPIRGGAMFGPEFAILSTTTTLSRINMMNALVYNGIPIDNGVPNYRPYGTRIDPANLAAYATGTDDDLINGLGQIMTASTLPADARGEITGRISGISDPAQKAQQAAYLIATSSSYNVQR